MWCSDAWSVVRECSLYALTTLATLASLPLPPQELESHGIWDFDRLCEPWITDEVRVCGMLRCRKPAGCGRRHAAGWRARSLGVR